MNKECESSQLRTADMSVRYTNKNLELETSYIFLGIDTLDGTAVCNDNFQVNYFPIAQVSTTALHHCIYHTHLQCTMDFCTLTKLQHLQRQIVFTAT